MQEIEEEKYKYYQMNSGWVLEELVLVGYIWYHFTLVRLPKLPGDNWVIIFCLYRRAVCHQDKLDESTCLGILHIQELF